LENAINAFMSFGKQLPPYPRPAFRNCGFILLSRPMALAMMVMSVSGIFWHMFAIVFMKLIFVARKVLFAYFMSSAVGRFVLIIGGVFSP